MCLCTSVSVCLFLRLSLCLSACVYLSAPVHPDRLKRCIPNNADCVCVRCEYAYIYAGLRDEVWIACLHLVQIAFISTQKYEDVNNAETSNLA